jgi:hypothetical protein
MIEVTVIRRITKPEYQTLKQTVRIPAYTRLTPLAARAALEIAFGQPYGGDVWHKNTGYRVYKRSARKIKNV